MDWPGHTCRDTVSRAAYSPAMHYYDVPMTYCRRSVQYSCVLVQVNVSLTRLYIAWNGLAMEGCNELGKALTTNTHLVELDVSANRVNGVACRRLLAGLRTNTTLRCLRVGNCE